MKIIYTLFDSFSCCFIIRYPKTNKRKNNKSDEIYINNSIQKTTLKIPVFKNVRKYKEKANNNKNLWYVTTVKVHLII